jgi:hypothetical protein
MAGDSDNTGRWGVHIAAAAFEAIGFAFREQLTSNFGIDAHIEPRCDSCGTGELIALQIKSGDSYFREVVDGGWLLRTDQEHADYWLKHALPVIITQVDITEDRVYWASVTRHSVEFTTRGAKILIPKHQRVDVESLPALRTLLSPTRDLEPAAEGSGCRVFLGRCVSGLGGWQEFAMVLIGQIAEIGCVSGWDILVEVRTAVEDDELTYTNEWGDLGEDLASIGVDWERRVATYSVSSKSVDRMGLDLLKDEDRSAEATADAILQTLMAADGLLDDDVWLDDEDACDES